MKPEDWAAASEHVEATLCDDPEVEFVVVFGSYATGRPRPSSDLDVAVKFSDELTSEERFRKRCRLSGRLQRADAPFVDLSDLDELSIEFAHAATNGELLCGDEDAFRSFEAEIDAEFERRKEDIERRNREFIRRIAEDGLHG